MAEALGSYNGPSKCNKSITNHPIILPNLQIWFFLLYVYPVLILMDEPVMLAAAVMLVAVMMLVVVWQLASLDQLLDVGGVVLGRSDGLGTALNQTKRHISESHHSMTVCEVVKFTLSHKNAKKTSSGMSEMV